MKKVLLLSVVAVFTATTLTGCGSALAAASGVISVGQGIVNLGNSIDQKKDVKRQRVVTDETAVNNAMVIAGKADKVGATKISERAKYVADKMSRVMVYDADQIEIPNNN